ncbi:lengsin-like [Haliotis rubra]|uniref:lengsin-like n=1 Tax=Haliotis rubra TaxID=36100 RepID=UPI001EE5DD3F|nr:lengsin-like [Haliotis rubra]
MSDHINKYDYVRFSVADMHGRLRGRVVPARHVKITLETGVNCNLYAGFLAFGLHNEATYPSDKMENSRVPKAYARPDLDTLYNVSWSGQDDIMVAEIICESYWLNDGSAQLACPRYVARQQLEKLTNLGFSLFSGYEIEFTLTQTGKAYPHEPGYMRQRLVSKHDSLIFYLEKHMHQAGVDIGTFHSEGDPGLFEILIKSSCGIESADSCIIFKNGILEMGDKKDYSVNFTSMQESGAVGMHFNHSLWSLSDGINVFHDPDNPHGLSTLGKHWLAGLMKHAKALSAFFCPTINCYDRLHRPNLPGLIYWSTDKRSACLKLKSSERGTYLENRIPSGMTNPYLTMAATIAAGLDGVVKKLDCPPSDTFSSSDALPPTLSEAINDLLADKDIVYSLGKEFIDWFVCTIKTDINAATEMVCSGIK